MNNKQVLMMAAFATLSATFTACSDNDYVIESNPNEFAILPIAVPVSAEGGTYEVKITGDREWQIKLSDYNTKSTDWCTLSQTSGHGAATISINVTPSTSFVKNRNYPRDASTRRE
jgi:hypothetical protein